MEGVAFGLKDSAQLMEREVHIEDVRASGGGAASSVWLQILADVLEKPIRVVEEPESPALGAAILAATGLGGFSSISEACSAAIQLGDTYEPDTHSNIYPEMYAVYRDLYPLLRDNFRRLSLLDT
jgi:xylulokinase